MILNTTGYSFASPFYYQAMQRVYFICITFEKDLLVKEANKNKSKKSCRFFFNLLINIRGKLFLHSRKKSEEVHLFLEKDDSRSLGKKVKFSLVTVGRVSLFRIVQNINQQTNKTPKTKQKRNPAEGGSSNVHITVHTEGNFCYTKEQIATWNINFIQAF